MRALVACEESQEVCKAFRALGHEAYSCDIQECSGGHPEWHILGDVLPFLEPQKIRLWDAVRGSDVLYPAVLFTTMDGVLHQVPKWDLIIAHPPCTDLAVSGARHFARKRADGSQQRSIDFFMRFTNLSCEKVAIENPVCIMSSIYRQPDQIIQPWQFGHPVSKKTCLWLKGLPPLVPTDVVEPEIIHSKGKSGGYSGASWNIYDENGKPIRYSDPRVARARSKTFHGIAKAMAEQWGGLEPPKEEA